MYWPNINILLMSQNNTGKYSARNWDFILLPTKKNYNNDNRSYRCVCSTLSLS